VKTKVALAAALLMAVVAAWLTFHLLSQPAPKLPPEITREEFIAEVRGGHVHQVTIWDRSVITGRSSTRGNFRTAFHADDRNLASELRTLGVEVLEKESEDTSPGPLF
jgi:hypothetical protein